MIGAVLLLLAPLNAACQHLMCNVQGLAVSPSVFRAEQDVDLRKVVSLMFYNMIGYSRRLPSANEF